MNFGVNEATFSEMNIVNLKVGLRCGTDIRGGRWPEAPRCAMRPTGLRLVLDVSRCRRVQAATARRDGNRGSGNRPADLRFGDRSCAAAAELVIK